MVPAIISLYSMHKGNVPGTCYLAKNIIADT